MALKIFKISLKQKLGWKRERPTTNERTRNIAGHAKKRRANCNLLYTLALKFQPLSTFPSARSAPRPSFAPDRS
jgi:hypothetical protein